MIRSILSYLSFSLIIFGTLAFILNVLISIGFFESSGELPLEDIQGITEKNDRIYVGLGSYNRVQVYDLKGNFIKRIRTRNYAKDFNFVVLDDGTIDINVIFSRETSNRSKFEQENGTLYSINSPFPKRISKIENGIETIIIQQSYFMSLYSGLNSLIVLTIAMALFSMTNRSIIDDVFSKEIHGFLKFKLLIKRALKW